MLTTIVTNQEELEQIHALNRQNLKQNLDQPEQEAQGFVSWLYSMELLENMHALAPSIIIKDGNQVVAYSLTTLKESRAFHPDLATMFKNLESVIYKGRPLSAYHFYCMGQICVHKAYRGKNLVKQLYEGHRERYSGDFDFILTEIATRNLRSMKAHEKIGFEIIYTYRDHIEEWAVVVWEWK